jgi:F0F1-type ATP synthase assembly protein I
MSDDSPRTLAPRVAPAHLAIRFALELALLAAFAYWGWHLGDGGVLGGLLAVVLPAVGAAVWAIFRTAGDTGQSRPVVAIPGPMRLALELALIGLAAYGVWTSGSRAAAETVLTAFALHYAVTWHRVVWLIRQ